MQNSEPRTRNPEAENRIPEVSVPNQCQHHPASASRFTLHASRSSFTLMEMLAVVAIIAVLAGLIIPVLGYAKLQAKKTRAREEMNGLRIALRSFYQEYGYWPHGSTTWSDLSTMLNGNINPYTGVAATSTAWATTNNTRAIRFLEFKRDALNSSAAFIDPWGNPYIVLMDHGGGAFGDAGWVDSPSGRESGTVENPVSGLIQTQIAIYSFGEDEVDGNGANSSDDVKTWTN